MEYNISIYSKEYSPSPDTDQYSIQVDDYLWNKEINNISVGNRKYLYIKNGMKEWVSVMGSPVSLSLSNDEEPYNNTTINRRTNRYNIYMPLWMIDSSGLMGVGENATMLVLTEDAFPPISKVIFRVIDSTFYNSDVKSELEKALISLGVIRKNTTLKIPISSLDNFEVDVYVVDTEPADIVLCNSDEVETHFEEPVDYVEPVKQINKNLIPDTNILINTTEQKLNAIYGIEEEKSKEEVENKFKGEGVSLGYASSSDVSSIPEWRRNLGPPRQRPKK